jgi:drug/metabolite transporter (DMT)-like permease
MTMTRVDLRRRRDADGTDILRRMPTFNRSVSPTDMVSLLMLAAVWGGAFLFFRIASPEVGPIWAAETRLIIAAGTLAIVAGPRAVAVVRRRPRAFAIVGATFSAIPFSLIAFAALTLPTGFGALLNASTPLFTAVLGVVVLGQRLSRRITAGLVVGLVAVFVLVGWSPLAIGPDLVLAVAAALGAALSYAVAGTYVRQSLAGVGGLELATGQLAFGAVILLPFAILSGPPGLPSAAGALSLVLLGVVATALAWPVYFRVLSRTTPTAASTVTFVVPAFAIAWGGLVLSEPVGPELVAGFGLVLVSLALILGLRLSVVPLGRWRRRRAIPATAT